MLPLVDRKQPMLLQPPAQIEDSRCRQRDGGGWGCWATQGLTDHVTLRAMGINGQSWVSERSMPTSMWEAGWREASSRGSPRLGRR